MRRVTTSMVEIANIEAKRMTSLQRSRLAKITREDTLRGMLESKQEMKEDLGKSFREKKKKNLRLLRLCCSKIPPQMILSYKN